MGWQVICGKHAPYMAATVSCYWTGFLNNWEEPLLFNCPNDRVITGMQSYHNNGKEDRRFRVRCCGVSGKKAYNCQWSSYANNWEQAMDYSVPDTKVMTGVFSYHDNIKEDRRW